MTASTKEKIIQVLKGEVPLLSDHLRDVKDAPSVREVRNPSPVSETISRLKDYDRTDIEIVALNDTGNVSTITLTISLLVQERGKGVTLHGTFGGSPDFMEVWNTISGMVTRLAREVQKVIDQEG